MECSSSDEDYDREMDEFLARQLDMPSLDTTDDDVHNPYLEEYNSNIDRVVNSYEEAVKNEIYYLLETTYQVYRYNISCGISPARSFSPAVILRKHLKPGKISFNVYEWSVLIATLTQKIDDFFHEDLPTYPISFPCGEYCTIKQDVLQGSKVIFIHKHDESYYMVEEEVHQILKLNNDIISQRISLLGNLNLCEYYYSVINFCMNNANNCLSPLQILYSFCCIVQNDLLNAALKEFIYFYKTRVVNDLENKN